MWLDVEAARAQVSDPWTRHHMRLEPRPPGPCPDHGPADCPPLDVPGFGKFTTFPGLLVTPRHRVVIGWHRHLSRGRAIRADPFLCWPAPLAQAFDALG